MNIPDKIGLIAGASEFPFLIGSMIKKISPASSIFTVGLTGEIDNRLKNISSQVKFIEPGMLGEIENYLKTVNVRKAVMAGLVRHKKLFDSKLKIDPVMMKLLSRIKDKRADSILSAIADEFKANGVEIIPLIELLGNNIAVEGTLTKNSPDEKQLGDIEFGSSLAMELSKFDIGQTIVVKDRCVVAVEALEGTDMCILRSGELAGENTVIIKVAKHSQDLRFDLPVIGINTLKNMAKVSSRVIAVEAGKTCLVNKDELIAFADKNGLSIVGIKINRN